MAPIRGFVHLPAILRSALLWAIGWSLVAALVTAALLLVDPPAEKTLAAWAPVLVLPLKFALIGFVAGLAFATLASARWRGRRLADLTPLRAALAGAIVTAVFVPCFLQAMNILSGDGMVPWSQVADDGAITAVFGGIAAYASRRFVFRRGAVDEPPRLGPT